MKRYAVKVLNEGKYKFYYILDNVTYDVVLYPSKFLKHKIDANRSPNTVRRMPLHYVITWSTSIGRK